MRLRGRAEVQVRLDDSLDVVGVHLVGGIVGTVLIGFLSTAAPRRHRRAVLRRRTRPRSATRPARRGSRSSGPPSFTTLIGLGIKYTIGWRIDEEDEVEGIDFAEHGETAYDFARGARVASGDAGPPPAATTTDSEGALA